jgi:2-polyprenyl-3-methyl-5-hydroxy-6-metoxy-1,4-benzoquinol methylase
VDRDRAWPRHLQPGEQEPRQKGRVETELLTGCCFAAHSDVWRAVGLFDETLFLIFEDSDWSMRARLHGYQLLLEPTSIVRHKVSRSIEAAGSSIGLFYYCRNGLIFARRWLGMHAWLRFLFGRVAPLVLRRRSLVPLVASLASMRPLSGRALYPRPYPLTWRFQCKHNGPQRTSGMTQSLPEAVDRLVPPVYRPYTIVREMLHPGDTVLDVGCGNAKVSAYLAETGAIIDGIEPTESRAAIARERLRYVSTQLAGHEDPNLQSQYDLITFFDVLEHVADPDQLLRWALTRLKPRGHIAAVIPNSAHYSFRLRMLRGDWSLQDWGLFDRTHLRFFDTRTMKELRPRGSNQVGLTFTAPGDHSGWLARLVRNRPNLFALHGVLIWQNGE